MVLPVFVSVRDRGTAHRAVLPCRFAPRNLLIGGAGFFGLSCLRCTGGWDHFERFCMERGRHAARAAERHHRVLSAARSAYLPYLTLSKVAVVAAVGTVENVENPQTLATSGFFRHGRYDIPVGNLLPKCGWIGENFAVCRLRVVLKRIFPKNCGFCGFVVL